MSYISLYRKWRPRVFEDVVEQEHVVRALRNSVISNRIAHAYLFCGTRGTGKTSMAHIFSRAINCLAPVNGNPCNSCEICTGILSGSILDVVEIDAASNNSVDNVREIRDEVVYAPSQARYKVYIIDEVHMLSTGAFNALLKTLEEPPPRVVFILATTEPHKLPPTILSRCQRFDFRRITPLSIAKRLNEISMANGITLEEEAALLIARMSDGALRDAISLLDQCMALGNSIISKNDVLTVAGIVNDAFMADMVDSIINRDAGSLLEAVDRLIAQGKDVAKFVGDLTLYFRNMLVCKVSASPGNLLDLPADAVERMKKQAASFDQNLLIGIIKDLSACEANLKWAVHPRILLEAMLIKLCEVDLNIDKEDILTRIARLEHIISAGNFGAVKYSTQESQSRKSDPEPAGTKEYGLEDAQKNAEGNTVISAETIQDKEEAAEESDKDSEDTVKESSRGKEEAAEKSSWGKKNVAETIQDKVEAAEKSGQGKKNVEAERRLGKEVSEWNLVIEDVKNCGKVSIYQNLIGTRAIELGNNTLGLVFSAGNKFCKMFVSKKENLEVVEAAASRRLGRAVRIKCLDEDSLEGLPEANFEQKFEQKDEVEERLLDIARKYNIPVDIIDE